MRMLAIIILVVVIAAGVVLGALNAAVTSYDFGFVQVQLPKGAAVLGAVAIGWLLGGMTAWLGVRLRRPRPSRRADKQPPPKP
ncbi:MAG: DUF1049 domain-containing protein [Rhodanobacter sp.]